MRKKILIVEDKKVNREILKKILADQYDLLEAEDGLEALEILNKEKNKISAVLLDIIMPKLDGYGVLKEISNNSRLKDIPVIVASQGDKGPMEERALRSGARDFIIKPYNPGTLKQRLANTIELSESIQHIANIEHDSLTGLYTKEVFYRWCEQIIDDSKQNFLLVAINIVQFKLVNDSFGNSQGNQLLKFIATNIKKQIKPIKGIAGRLESDHFAIMMPYQEGRDDYQELVNNLKEAIDDYPINMKISLKFGFYKILNKKLDISLMCDRAFLAADTIKGKYGINGAFYNDSMRQHLRKEQRIVDTMKKGLANNQFKVYLQPKYNLITQHVAGAEALVRWIHPEYGFMQPSEFIPLFEKNGFISELDMFVWEETCKIIARWIKGNGKFVPVSVNVSRKDIYQKNILEIFPNLIKKYNLKPEYLHLEITESAYGLGGEHFVKVVKGLKKAGFIIEMDDFGTGYSSLNVLSELPIDILKLDMRFIQQKEENAENKNILSFIISMAKWMNLSVIAEGVETQEQINMLLNISCDYVQGFYYSKPVEVIEFTERILNPDPLVELMSETSNKKHQHYLNNTTLEKKKLLVIGPALNNNHVFEEMFKQLYQIITLEVNKAFNYIQRHFDEIDIIVINQDLEILTKIKDNPLYQTIPVIIVDNNDNHEAKAFELGASDFITKIMDPFVLKRRIENVIIHHDIQIIQKEKEMLIKTQKLIQEAKLDLLTGAFNQIEMKNRIEEYFCYESSECGILLMVDIDDFKMINRVHGHLFGDEILVKIARMLLNDFRGSDIVCRMGGDEFGIFFKTMANRQKLEKRLQQLCQKLSFEASGCLISCSIGAARAPTDSKDYWELYNHTKTALNRAKELGNKQYIIY